MESVLSILVALPVAMVVIYYCLKELSHPRPESPDSQEDSDRRNNAMALLEERRQAAQKKFHGVEEEIERDPAAAARTVSRMMKMR